MVTWVGFCRFYEVIFVQKSMTHINPESFVMLNSLRCILAATFSQTNGLRMNAFIFLIQVHAILQKMIKLFPRLIWKLLLYKDKESSSKLGLPNQKLDTLPEGLNWKLGVDKTREQLPIWSLWCTYNFFFCALNVFQATFFTLEVERVWMEVK